MPNPQSFVVCAACLFTFVSTAPGQELRAGAAKRDITPPLGHPMWGYASRRDQPSKAVREPLHARACVLEINKQRLAFVSLDLGRAPSRRSREVIATALKMNNIEYFFLVASHTHHGPVLELETWPNAKKPYVRELEQKIIAAVQEAARSLQPARLGIARSEEELNRNRHSRRKDKPVDRELIVVRVEARDTGKPIAHLVNFAAHPTMLSASLHEFSPDYPAFLCGHVEKDQGGLCLFLQGAAGDLSPNGGEARTPETFGRKIGDRVLALARSVKMEVNGKSLDASRHTFVFGKRIDLDNPFIRTAYSIAFFPDLVSFYEREYREGVRPEMTVALIDERIGIVGVSGEFFSGHALSLKRRARLDHLLFLGYCNDYQQYFPTIEAVAEGGYGADELVSPVEIGAGERMMDGALMELYRMRGAFK